MRDVQGTRAVRCSYLLPLSIAVRLVFPLVISIYVCRDKSRFVDLNFCSFLRSVCGNQWVYVRINNVRVKFESLPRTHVKIAKRQGSFVPAGLLLCSRGLVGKREIRVGSRVILFSLNAAACVLARLSYHFVFH